MSRHRAWVFTSYAAEMPASGGFEYMVVQRERCPTSGRLHWQGYCVCKHPVSLGGMQRLLPGAHLEVRRGSHADARAYCTKDDTRVAGPFEFGREPVQGERTDLGDLCDLVRQGRSDRELAEAHPVSFLRYGAHINRLRMALLPPRSTKTRVVVLRGPTGCGKSRWAFGQFGDECYVKDGSQWWDGYCGQRVVVLDEFYGQLAHSFMLTLMDRYPLNVQVKGGYATFNSPLIIITSNTDPREWYSGLTEKGVAWKPQFWRRIDYEYQFMGGEWWRANLDAGIDDPIWEEAPLPEPGQLLAMGGRGPLPVDEPQNETTLRDTDVIDLTQE